MIWKNIFSRILNLVFPTKCVLCNSNYGPLCDICVASLPLCVKHFDPEIVSVFSYDNPSIRKALWSLKYKNNTALVPIFARLLYDKILEELDEQKKFRDFTDPLLIPIPLHKKRKRQRGYNQSELICKGLSLIDPVSFTFEKNVLYRHRYTQSQTGMLNKKKRLENISGCFLAQHPEKIQGRNIILIDDIVTTGATLKEASRILKRAGAKKVIAFTVAH